MRQASLVFAVHRISLKLAYAFFESTSPCAHQLVLCAGASRSGERSLTRPVKGSRATDIRSAGSQGRNLSSRPVGEDHRAGPGGR